MILMSKNKRNTLMKYKYGKEVYYDYGVQLISLAC